MASTSAVRLPPLPSIRDVIRMYGLRARRQLSQNFLMDMNLTRKLVSKCGDIDGKYVCEVGPGPGGITRALLERGPCKLSLIEKDRRFLPGLELLGEACPGVVDIHMGDVMNFDMSTLFPLDVKKLWHGDPPDVFVVGNLPFSVSTHLIIRFLRAMSLRQGPFAYGRTVMTLTFQKEVGERMVAPILSDQRCRLSAMCQYVSHVRRKMTIPGRAFVPAPKVDVVLMQFEPRKEPLIDQHFDLVEKFCRHLFHFRNKYCIRGVETLYPKHLRDDFAHEVLRTARINPKDSAPSLDVEEIRDMCIVYEQQCLRVPHLFYYDYRQHRSFEETMAKYPVLPPINDSHTHVGEFATASLFRRRYECLILVGRSFCREIVDGEPFVDVRQDKIRNFSIIAHVDHGKSTLADRLMEATHTIEKRVSNVQVLDRLKVERERGITVKAQSVSMLFKSHKSNEPYMLNLIDTPGHVDFSYEVSRSVVASDGALLVVDVSQGVQAQTVANFWLAFESGLEILPVLNKCDLKEAKPLLVADQLNTLFDINPAQCLQISAKTGQGIEDLLEAIVDRVPHPQGDVEAPFSALLYDCWHDRYRGCYLVVVVRDGYAERGQEIVTLHNGKKYEIQEVGVLHPEPTTVSRLMAGYVGYILANVKSPKDAMIGDTICLARRMVPALAKFTPVKPMVFSGLYPVDSGDYDSLRSAVEKLVLTDPAVTLEPEHSPALGNGWRVGFLGLLHMEVFSQRLEDEYSMSVVLTAPNVPFKAVLKENEGIRRRYGGLAELTIVDPSKFPDLIDVDHYLEPMTRSTIVGPQQYYGQILNLCLAHRGELIKSEMVDASTLLMEFHLPLSEIVLDFYSDLKQLSSGYATFDYEVAGYRKAALVKLRMLINNTAVEELSCILPEEVAQSRGRQLCQRLAKEIPRQLYDVAIQAALGKRIIARENVKAIRKDFTQKLKGNFGDRTRVMKLIERQKEGKKRLKLVGQAEIPKEVFLKIFQR